MKKFKTILKTSDKNIIESIKRYNGTQDKSGLWVITATTKYEKEQNDKNRIFKDYIVKIEDTPDKKILSKEERVARFREKFGANDTKKTNNQYGGIEWWVNGMNGE
jgi:hypothetical protein